MISFNNDYSEVGAPEILEKLREMSTVSYVGYGVDEVCEQAKAKIRKYLGSKPCDIHFLVGGTQANLLMIAQMLRPFEAVISADTGHINVHESASVEATGHKVELVPGYSGKLKAADVEKLINNRGDEHQVQVKAVYISNPTEYGTLYTKAELQQLRELCDRYHMYLYLDGARMGSGLTSDENDLTLEDINNLTDCFYIGATKNGGMLGEAMVISNDEFKHGFRNMMKQRGALLAKGYILGAQFDCLFTDELFFRLGRHANEMASLLKKGLKEASARFYIDSPTNQQFLYMKQDVYDKLREKFVFSPFEPGEDELIIRLVTSWATRKEDVEEFIRCYKELA